MDRGAWWATVHGVAESRTWLSTHILCNHCIPQVTGADAIIHRGSAGEKLGSMLEINIGLECLAIWLLSPWVPRVTGRTDRWLSPGPGL